MRIYKQIDLSISLICYYSFIFGLLRKSIGVSAFGFIAKEYQRRAILLLSAIHYIQSAIRWAILKVILNYSRLPSRYAECHYAGYCYSTYHQERVIYNLQVHIRDNFKFFSNCIWVMIMWGSCQEFLYLAISSRKKHLFFMTLVFASKTFWPIKLSLEAI